MPDKNIIKKQLLHFQYNGKADGFALQKEVSDWCKFTLIPEIEAGLESYALADEYITIDKLVIDASIDKKDWQQQIRNELMSGLKKKLVNHQPVFNAAAVKSETVSKKLDELILFYFENGYLPWWGKALMEDSFETLMYNWIKETLPQPRADLFSERLQQMSTAPVVERIVNLLPQPMYFQFLQNIFKIESGLIGDTAVFFKELLPAGIPAAKRLVVTRSVYGFMLMMMARNRGKLDTALLLQFVYEELNMHKVAVKPEIPVAAKTKHINNPLKTAWHKLLIKEDKIAKKKISDPVRLKKKLRYNKMIDKLTGQNADAKLKPPPEALVQEGIYIENAGAVIIAAFIPALFEKLKISKNQAIVKSNLAAMMIQYVVTGKKTMAEHELVLPKILCGMALEMPVNTDSRITTVQAKEADEMLAALIEYWAVIKNTSVNGLRESFLQRSGKLFLLNDEWLLQVEQKPFDMLLQQLPWSISMIRLPWMNNLLKTEWI